MERGCPLGGRVDGQAVFEGALDGDPGFVDGLEKLVEVGGDGGAGGAEEDEFAVGRGGVNGGFSHAGVADGFDDGLGAAAGEVADLLCDVCHVLADDALDADAVGELAARGHGVDADDAGAVKLEQLSCQVADEAEAEDDDPVVDVAVGDLGGGDGDHAHADGGGEVAGDVFGHWDDDGVGVVHGTRWWETCLRWVKTRSPTARVSTADPSSIARPQLA